MGIKQDMAETKSKDTVTRRAPKLTPAQFVVKNFNLPREIEEKTSFKPKGGESKDAKETKTFQYILFPKYTYSQSSGEDNSKADPVVDTLCVLTPPIEIKRGGLLKADGEWRKSDEDCKSAWIPLQKEFGGDGAVELYEMFKKIDKHFQDKMKKNPTDFLVLKKGKEESKLSGELVYNTLVKEAVAPDNATDFVPWLRGKVVIPSKDGKTINVKLIVPGDDGEQVKKVVTSIAELRKDFAYGCTAQFYLNNPNILGSKTATKGKRECGFKVVCDMINIVERSKLGGKANVEWDDLLGDDDSVKPSKQPVKATKGAKDDNDKASDSDTDAKSDDDDAKSDASDAKSEPEPEPPKKETKGKSKETAKEPAKETKKTKKGSKKEEASDDSDDDTAKKPAKGGKSKTK